MFPGKKLNNVRPGTERGIINTGQSQLGSNLKNYNSDTKHTAVLITYRKGANCKRKRFVWTSVMCFVHIQCCSFQTYSLFKLEPNCDSLCIDLFLQQMQKNLVIALSGAVCPTSYYTHMTANLIGNDRSVR